MTIEHPFGTDWASVKTPHSTTGGWTNTAVATWRCGQTSFLLFMPLLVTCYTALFRPYHQTLTVGFNLIFKTIDHKPCENFG